MTENQKAKLIEKCRTLNAHVIKCAEDLVKNGGTQRTQRHVKAVNDFFEVRLKLQEAGIWDDSMKMKAWYFNTVLGAI